MKNNNIQRYFIPGDEWLYFKLYCGVKTADIIIEQALLPLTTKLLSDKIISKWFFIRYNDPELHIRFRLFLNNSEEIGHVIRMVKNHIQLYVDSRMINKVLLDTYSREVERYGSNTIEIFENLFCYDSILIANLLSNIEGDEGEIIRWQFCLRTIDQLLNDFNFTLLQKLEIFTGLSNSFMTEFNADKQMHKQINEKYRQSKQIVETILNRTKDDESEMLSLFEILNQHSEYIKPHVEQILKLNEEGKLETSLYNLISSYIHMHCNRLFRSKQRMQEMVIYRFLELYYRSEKYRNNL